MRLLFCEPLEKQSGQRVFNVSAQGALALSDVDVVDEAGGAGKLLIEELADVAARTGLPTCSSLTTLLNVSGKPVMTRVAIRANH